MAKAEEEKGDNAKKTKVCIPSGISETWRLRLFAPKVVTLDTPTGLINSVREKQKYYINILFKFYDCAVSATTVCLHYPSPISAYVVLIWALVATVCLGLIRSQIKCGFPNVLFSVNRANGNPLEPVLYPLHILYSQQQPN